MRELDCARLWESLASLGIDRAGDRPRWGSDIELDVLLSSVAHRWAMGGVSQQSVQFDRPSLIVLHAAMRFVTKRRPRSLVLIAPW